MTENYTWKEATGKLLIRDFKPNYNMTFHNQDGKHVGTLDFDGPEMTFTGDADESAKVFFYWVAKSFTARLEQERADEREACLNCYSPDDTAADWADRIRARGNT